MLRTYRLTLTARDTLAGLSKCHSRSLVLLALRRPLSIAIFVHIRIIQREVSRNRNIHWTSLRAVRTGCARDSNGAIYYTDHFIYDLIFLL